MATREKTGRKLKTTAERKERKATSERRPRAVRTDGAGKGSTDYTAEGLFARGAEARKRLADGLSPFREGSKKQLAFEALREGMTMEQLKKHLSWTNTGTIQTQLWEIAKALGKERAHDKETGIYSFK